MESPGLHSYPTSCLAFCNSRGDEEEEREVVRIGAVDSVGVGTASGSTTSRTARHTLLTSHCCTK